MSWLALIRFLPGLFLGWSRFLPFLHTHRANNSSKFLTLSHPPCLASLSFASFNLPSMSNQSLAETLSSTYKKVDAAAKPAVITAPPHFGDLGKAANDTFSKVHSILFYSMNWTCADIYDEQDFPVSGTIQWIDRNWLVYRNKTRGQNQNTQWSSIHCQG